MPLRKEGRPLAVYKKVLFKARPVELLFTFCPNLSNCQSECEVCCSDVNVALLEQCCNYSKQCRNNVATLCCAKNRRCESCTITLISKITTLYVHQAFLYIFLPFLRDYDVKIPNFVFYGERKQVMTKFLFRFLNSNMVTWNLKSGGFAYI